MKWKRVPNSESRKTEGATAIVRGDPGNDKQMFVERAQITRRNMRCEFKKVGRLLIVKCFECNFGNLEICTPNDWKMMNV